MCYFNRNPVEKKKYILKIFRSVVFFLNPFFFSFLLYSGRGDYKFYFAPCSARVRMSFGLLGKGLTLWLGLRT